MRERLPSLCLLAASLIAHAPERPAMLTIHADQPVSSVSPTLYGLMTEEINYSYDGGLYAEMVRNRTFRGDWSGITLLVPGRGRQCRAPRCRWTGRPAPARR